MFNLSLSIVIPIYNEQENIGKLIDKINSLLIKKIKKFQIIVVDDNSSDNSKLIIKKKIKKFKNIKYFLRKKNRDLSKSVIKGFEMSKYNNIIVMDGDLQHNPIYILKFVDILISKNSDFIIGSRNFKNYNFKKSLSYTRYLFSKIVILLNNLCLKLKLKDPMSGYFLFKKKFYSENKKFLYGKGFKILLDLIVASKKKNQLKIDEFYINFNARDFGKSKMNMRIGLIYLFFLIKQLIK